MKITLFLLSSKGLSVLSDIIDNCQTSAIESVVIGEDPNVENDYSAELRQLCIDNNLRYFSRKEFKNIESKYALAISWRWLINASPNQLIVLHDSLLPKYRGFAPLVNMLINKEKKIGVTAIYADSEYDRGDIIYQSSSEINYPITIQEAISIVEKNYLECVRFILQKIVSGNPIIGVPQDNSEATYSLWRDEDDYLIDWTQSAENILNLINSVSYPYKGASTRMNNSIIRVKDAEIYPDVIIENRTPGKVIFLADNFPVIVCGQGLLKLTNVTTECGDSSVLPFKNFRVRLK